MPRARLLKPGFFKNVTLAQMSARHRLLFAGLWTLADRDGRLKDEPAWIRAELFPYEPGVDVDPLLTDLQHAGFIVRYSYEDRTKAARTRTKDGRTSRVRFRAIALPTFSAHQTPHHRERPSAIPPPTSKRSRPQSAAPDTPPTKDGPALGQPESSRTVPDPVPVTGDPVTGDPVPDPVSKEKSSAAPEARAAQASDNGHERPDDNVGVITKLAHEMLDLGVSRNGDLAEAVKARCAQLHIAYDSAVVRKAIDSADAQRHHR
jgi:hypothetical protein